MPHGGDKRTIQIRLPTKHISHIIFLHFSTSVSFLVKANSSQIRQVLIFFIGLYTISSENLNSGSHENYAKHDTG